MNTYLVIAVYWDDYERFATTVEADTPEDAELAAQTQARENDEFQDNPTPLIIAAVLLDGEVVG